MDLNFTKNSYSFSNSKFKSKKFTLLIFNESLYNIQELGYETDSAEIELKVVNEVINYFACNNFTRIRNKRSVFSKK